MVNHEREAWLLKVWRRAISAIDVDNAARLEELLEQEPEIRSLQDPSEDAPTLLHAATMRDKLACVRILAKGKCNIHHIISRKYGEPCVKTPMELAIYCVDPLLRRELFDSLMMAAEPGIGESAQGWQAAMFAAAYRGDEDILAAINSHCGQEGRALWGQIRDEDGFSILHAAAVGQSDSVKTLRMLLSWEGMEAALEHPDGMGRKPRDLTHNEEFIQELDTFARARAEAEEISKAAKAPEELRGKAARL